MREGHGRCWRLWRHTSVPLQEKHAAARTTLCTPRVGGWRLWLTAVPLLCRWDMGTGSSCHHHLGDTSGTGLQGGSTPGYISLAGLQKSGPVLLPGVMGAMRCGDNCVESPIQLVHGGCCSPDPSKLKAAGSKGEIPWGAAPFPQHNIPMPGLETLTQVHSWKGEQGHAEIPWAEAICHGEPPCLQHPPTAARGTHRGQHWTGAIPHPRLSASHWQICPPLGD